MYFGTAIIAGAFALLLFNSASTGISALAMKWVRSINSTQPAYRPAQPHTHQMGHSDRARRLHADKLLEVTGLYFHDVAGVSLPAASAAVTVAAVAG
jgi:hypothetical protein